MAAGEIVMVSMQTRRRTGLAMIRRGLALGFGLALLARAGAVERILRIEAPATVVAGQPLTVTIRASTDAGQGEQVGFLQVEDSLDDGRTWTAICYLQKSGPKVERTVRLVPGAAGTKVKLRARAAYRDGPAGDVDFSGAPIAWGGGWTDWKTPPTKHALIVVTAR